MDKKIKPPILGGFLMFGGDDRDRTDYLLNAIQALSQVSYAPITDTIISKLTVFVNILFFFFQEIDDNIHSMLFSLNKIDNYYIIDVILFKDIYEKNSNGHFGTC